MDDVVLDVGYRRHRKDSNHDETAEAFGRLGWSVWDTSQLGHGFPDMVIAKNYRTAVIEVKSGDEALRKSQDRFMLVWQGEAHVVRSLEDVERINAQQEEG